MVKSKFFLILKNKYLLFWQMFKFGLVGVINTALDFSAYTILTRFFIFWRGHYLWANLISMLIAATSSFFCNKYWTFKDKNGGVKKQYLKFLAVSLGGLIINEFILLSLVEYFDVYDLMAKGVGVIVVFFWNFFANKYWTFTCKK